MGMTIDFLLSPSAALVLSLSLSRCLILALFPNPGRQAPFLSPPTLFLNPGQTATLAFLSLFQNHSPTPNLSHLLSLPSHQPEPKRGKYKHPLNQKQPNQPQRKHRGEPKNHKNPYQRLPELKTQENPIR